MQDDVLERLMEIIGKTEETADRRLPPEGALSEMLGVTRGRLRTLLKRLEAEGLIWRHIGKGTFVGPKSMAPSNTKSGVSVSIDTIMSARLTLEPQLARRAAVSATSEDIKQLQSSISEMAEAKSFLVWRLHDERLHRCIAAATHNDVLLMMYDVLRGQMASGLSDRIEAKFGPEDAPKEESNSAHFQIVKAIVDHDPSAAETAMRSHLLMVRQQLFDL